MDLLSTRTPALATTALTPDQNSTNSSQCPSVEYDPWFISGQPVYILVITVLGIVFNLFILMIFCLHKKSCTVAEIYLSNLAAADLLLVSCLPFWAVNILNDFKWPFGLFLCKAVNTGIYMNTYCSIYFLVLVGIDRYVALVHPMSHGRLRRPKYAKMAVLLVWCFGFILTIPALAFRTLEYFPVYEATYCYLHYPDPTVEMFCDILLVLLGFIIPTTITSYCTVKIIQALKSQPMERFNAEKTENKATVLVLAVLLAFLICWVPFHLLTIIFILLKAASVKDCDLHHDLDLCNQIFTYLAFFNSVLNPILYVLVGKNFRKKIREVFKQFFPPKKMSAESTRSHLSSTLKTTI